MTESDFASQAVRRPTAILSALAEEQQGLIALLHQPRETRHAGRDFWQGELQGQPVVLALSRIGKVAAATTATALIEHFGVARIVFIGVAGGLGTGVEIGDVVVASEFMQHDMDAAPLFARFEVPLYDRARFATDTALTAQLLKAARHAVQTRQTFLPNPSAYPNARLHHGLIATGDAFITEQLESRTLRTTLCASGFDALAVEMEGAAVAQVCYDYGVPFAAVRTISDRADGTAHVDFPKFANEVAGRYAVAIIRVFMPPV